MPGSVNWIGPGNFMIGWKCKIGIVYSDSILHAGSSIDEIEFIEDSVFTIATKYVSGTLPIGEGNGKWYYNTSEPAQLLEKVLGDDYFTWYNYLSRNPKKGSNTYQYEPSRLMVPSLFLASKKLTEIMLAQPSVHSVGAYLYIPKLGAILYGSQGSQETYVGRVVDNKIDSWFAYGALAGHMWYSNPVMLAVLDYSSGMDLSTAKFVGIRIAIASNPAFKPYEMPYIAPFDRETSSTTIAHSEQWISTLFATNSIPDFENVIPPDNPYEPGGDSGEGGGGGTFDDDSDLIPDSSLPTLSSAATGFTRIYNPTLAQLNQLATYLWTDESIIQTIWNHAKQFFEDPMSVIIGLNIVPVPVPNGGTENFRVLYIDTGIPLTYAASQFVDVDCGTLEIKRYYGSALDQAPYTKISCFLPFIGTVQLNTDEVMGATLQVKYRVDICSGSCVAKIFVDGNCIYQYSGHCAINVPVSSADFSSYVSAAISVAKLAIGAAVGGGMTALAAAGADPVQQTSNTTTIKTTNTERNPATGRQITTGTTTQTVESIQERPNTTASFSGLSPANVSNTVGEIMTAKPHVEHSGSFSGNTGYLGVRRPFVIIERPNMCMPASYQQFNGFPCMITLELAECSGFTRVQQVQLTGMSATNPEQAEILELLKSGVII